MASPRPPLSGRAAFEKHLFAQGYPLWSPDPELLPPVHQDDGLKIGDVGTIDEFGGFDVFFNLLDFTSGTTDSPLNFTSNDVRRGGEDLRPRVVVSSPQTAWNVKRSISVGVTYATASAILKRLLTL